MVASNKITDISRQDIVAALLLEEQPFHGRLDLLSFLRRIWQLKSMPSSDHRYDNAEDDIRQHMVNNCDWTYEELLYERLNILETPDEQFAAFLESCLHPLISPDPVHSAKLAALFNDVLRQDGFIMCQSGMISKRPTYKMLTLNGGEEPGGKYEVVLSFAGEDRPYVEQVAAHLRSHGVPLFYDVYEEVALWGKDLAEHLQQIYNGSAKYCLMFISRHYAEKVWTRHERKSAIEKAMKEKAEYILPVKFDNTELPGLHGTIGYIDLQHKTPEQLSILTLKKLGRAVRTKDN